MGWRNPNFERNMKGEAAPTLLNKKKGTFQEYNDIRNALIIAYVVHTIDYAKLFKRQTIKSARIENVI